MTVYLNGDISFYVSPESWSELYTTPQDLLLTVEVVRAGTVLHPLIVTNLLRLDDLIW